MNFTRMLVLLLLSVCFVVLPISAEAITFTVNSTVDDVDVALGNGICATASGVCTLRAAIQEANFHAGADTIVLKAKKYYLTIPGTAEESAATGDLDIWDHLTIKGISAAQTIINGSALDRVFHIINPVTVKFINLSIQNGLVQDNGGGIFNNGGIVSLTYCSIANNVSSSSTGLMGGGIFSTGVGSRLSIKSSSVIKNAVVSNTLFAYGGGIAVVGGTMNISASKIAYNSATSAASTAAAGGIYSNSDGVTITNSKVLANSTTSISGNSIGGGIMLLLDSTAAVITGTNISMNSSISSGGLAYGGGLYFGEEAATISSCTIKDNRATASASAGLGGGIMGFSSNITINKASTIISNLASFDGGGIKNSGSTITVSPNSTVTNNMPNNQS